jgi:probable F420-dependent oxidoreductase
MARLIDDFGDAAESGPSKATTPAEPTRVAFWQTLGMRFTVQYPLAMPGYGADFLTAKGIARFARAAEEAGFDALAFTEHPAPSHRWVVSGGHDTFDPPTALACAAVSTERILLLPYTLILPHRNPLLMAKTLATLAIASEGRLVVGAGTGYLRSEATALGVEFDARNELFDEAIEAMIAIWSGDNVTFQGRHFHAAGTTAHPRPAIRPPLWIGGNSARARERVARYGNVWMPLLIDQARVRMLRTPALPDLDTLRRAVDDLRVRVTACGRNPDAVGVQIEGPGTNFMRVGGSVDAHLAFLTEAATAGATRLVLDTPAASLEAAIDAIQRYGNDVIAKFV